MMENKDTQLPAKVVEEINEKALRSYPPELHHVQGETPIDLAEPRRHYWLAGATEYAIKLHACDKTNSALEEKNRGLEEEIKRLNEWQERAKKLLNPIWDFADKNIDMVAGESKTAAVINYIHQARAILRKVMIRHESGLLPNRLLYNEIKAFLDGTKETPGTIPE
jgi:hypothetical protein